MNCFSTREADAGAAHQDEEQLDEGLEVLDHQRAAVVAGDVVLLERRARAQRARMEPMASMFRKAASVRSQTFFGILEPNFFFMKVKYRSMASSQVSRRPFSSTQREYVR
jgi:hypothetical protein